MKPLIETSRTASSGKNKRTIVCEVREGVLKELIQGVLYYNKFFFKNININHILIISTRKEGVIL